MKNDSLNNAYKISLNLNGKYIYSLYIKFIPDLQAGYETPEDAKAAAEVALEDDDINKSYTITQGEDGKYYYVLSPEEKKPEENKPEEKNPGITIDEWLLKEAKKEAIEELKKAGITSDFYFNAINKAKTVEGVNALKNEILKAHADKEENPSTPEVTPTPGRQPSTPVGPYAPYEPSTPGKEDKKPGEDKKPEDKKPEDKKPGEDKKPEDKKPGEDKKPEDKKPGKEEKPANPAKPAKEEKENTDSPNKKEKKKLPKAGSEAEILTLAAAALSSVAGAFISLKKRK